MFHQIHDNPVTAMGAFSLLGAIKENALTAMWKLDMHVSLSCKL